MSIFATIICTVSAAPKPIGLHLATKLTSLDASVSAWRVQPSVLALSKKNSNAIEILTFLHKLADVS